MNIQTIITEAENGVRHPPSVVLELARKLGRIRALPAEITRYKHWKDSQGYGTDSMVVDDCGTWVSWGIVAKKIRDALEQQE